MNNKIQWVICHHSLTPLALDNDKAEKSFNENHKSRGFPKSELGWYIGYHWIIFSDGSLKRYRNDDEVGAHCKEGEINFKSIGICLEGNFDYELPTDAQKQALLKLITEIQTKYRIPNEKVVPHRKYATYKSCWGKMLPDDIMNYLRPPIIVHWSDIFQKFALDRGWLKEKKDPETSPKWGEIFVLVQRIYEDLTKSK